MSTVLTVNLKLLEGISLFRCVHPDIHELRLTRQIGVTDTAVRSDFMLSQDQVALLSSKRLDLQFSVPKLLVPAN